MPAQPLRTLLASSTPILRGKPGSMIFFSWFWEGEIFLWPSCVHCQQVILKWLCNESECNPMMLSKGVPPSFLEGYFKSIAVSWVKSLCSCSCQQSFTSVCASAREGVVPGVGMAGWKQEEGIAAIYRACGAKICDFRHMWMSWCSSVLLKGGNCFWLHGPTPHLSLWYWFNPSTLPGGSLAEKYTFVFWFLLFCFVFFSL